MDAIKILQATQTASWDYDETADVLYLSIGKPQSAIGVDIGDGIVLRYDEATKEVVGLTMIGLRAKLPKQISQIDLSQDLTQAAQQIQELLTQLQKSGVTVETAQEQMATDLATQAKSDPTVMGKLVGWGQPLANKAGETTVSEAVRAVVPMALKMLGIPS